MPPNNNKGIEVISLLDDSDVEDGAMARMDQLNRRIGAVLPARVDDHV